MKCILLTFFTAATLCAQPADPSVVESLADQLGAAEFGERLEAEKSLADLAEREPEATRDALKKRLERDDDPEIRNRIARVLMTISRTLPTDTVAFSTETLETKRWEQYGDEAGRVDFELEDGLLTFDSTARAADTAAFVHKFGDAAEKGGGFRFGDPLPAPDANRLTLDAEIKVLKQNVTRRGLAGVHLNLEDHRSTWGLMILEDGLFLYRQRETHKMDTTDGWHHYRLDIEGDLQRVFVDDMEKPVIEMVRPKDPGRHWATFGDGTAGAGAHAQIRNVYFTRFGD